MSGPLSGVRVVEFAGIGPGPFAGMLLGDMGADVVRLERPSTADRRVASRPTDVLQRNKRSVELDLKRPSGAALALDLVSNADLLIEGFRPGVMERLGLGPAPCLARNRRLVYGRMTGWGQAGPLADRAGHDIDYIALSGVLGLIGRQDGPPVPPLNLVGDFGGGGLLLAFGLLCGLVNSRSTGQGQVVDAAMADGAALVAAMVFGEHAGGRWNEARGTNLLDSGAPFYEVYECADGRFIAVGALERPFYLELLEVLGLDATELPDPDDRSGWPATKARFAEIFRSRPRDEWVALADGRDTCLAPVLALDEVAAHPHHRARNAFVEVGGVMQPAPAPRFTVTAPAVPVPPRPPGVDGQAALAAWGIDPARIDLLQRSGALFAR